MLFFRRSKGPNRLFSSLSSWVTWTPASLVRLLIPCVLALTATSPVRANPQDLAAVAQAVGEYCPVSLYGNEQPPLFRHTGLYLDNRGKVAMHHERTVAFAEALKTDGIQLVSRYLSTPVGPDPPAEEPPHWAQRLAARLGLNVESDWIEAVTNVLRRQMPPPDNAEFSALLEMIESGLPNGEFLDWAPVAGWISEGNLLTNPQTHGLHPLELMIAHDSHIDALLDQIVDRDLNIAFLMLSGSEKMLTEMLEEKDERTEKVLRLIKYCRRRGIPVLGICYGMHLVVYEALGVKPQWLRIPKDGFYELYQRGAREFLLSEKLEPGTLRAIFGKRRIREIKLREGIHDVSAGFHDPLMSWVNDIWAFKVHWQGFRPDDKRLLKYVKAKSNRFFVKSDDIRDLNKAIIDSVAELIRPASRVWGTQSHPELTEAFLRALTYVKEYYQALVDEKHSVDQIRWELGQGTTDRFGHHQAKIGRNFAHKAAFPVNWFNLLKEPARQLLHARLHHRDPTIMKLPAYLAAEWGTDRRKRPTFFYVNSIRDIELRNARARQAAQKTRQVAAVH